MEMVKRLANKKEKNTSKQPDEKLWFEEIDYEDLRWLETENR